MALAEFSLEDCHRAKEVPLHQVKTLSLLAERVFLVLFTGNLVQGIHIEGVTTVMAIEIIGFVSKIRHVERHPHPWNEILAVKESVVDGVSLGVPGGLHVDFPDIFGILGAVSVPVNVCQNTVVPAQIGVIAYGRKGTEIDTGFGNFLFLGSSSETEHYQKDTRKNSFHKGQS